MTAIRVLESFVGGLIGVGALILINSANEKYEKYKKNQYQKRSKTKE